MQSSRYIQHHLFLWPEKTRKVCLHKEIPRAPLIFNWGAYFENWYKERQSITHQIKKRLSLVVLFSAGMSGTDPFDMQYVYICTATQDGQATRTDSCALKVLQHRKPRLLGLHNIN